MSTIIHDLAQVLDERRTASPETSYTASLIAGGLASISEKLHEELDELIAAAEQLEGQEAAAMETGAIVHEAADLWFHCMVLLTRYRTSPTLVLEALEQRFGVSGHEEKRARRTVASK